MAYKGFRGVEGSKERDPQEVFRDTRTYTRKFHDACKTPKGLGAVLIVHGVLLLMVPALLEIVVCSAAIFLSIYLAEARHQHLPLRMPFDFEGEDYNDPLPTRRKNAKARGIFFLGNERNTNKELWMSANDMLTHMLLFGTTGAGKAQPLDAKVCTPGGWKRMGDLRIGDLVSTPDGQSAPITGVFPQGEIPIYRVRFSDGRSTEACGEHLWEVFSGFSDGDSAGIDTDARILTTADLEDQLADHKNLFVRLTAPVEFEHRLSPLSVDPYRIGFDAHTTCIPEIYNTASTHQRWRLLQGFMDADGDVDEAVNCLVYETHHEALANDVAHLVRSLGGTVEIEEGFPGFVLFIQINDPVRCFSLPEKQSLAEKIEVLDELKLRIESIEFVGKKPAQCIAIDHPDHLYITDDYVVTHNTETLLSISWNSLSMGSGLIFIDPKGTNKLWLQVWSMSRYVGRDDDCLLINYSTGNRTIEDRSPVRLSNTSNPFAHGTADFLSDIMNSLIPTSEGDNAIFSERAVALMKTLMMGLVEMRDQKRLNLSVKTIREHMTMEKCIEIMNDPLLSDTTKASMASYLNSVAGFDKGKGASQAEDTMKQFGYAVAYFTRSLSSLTDTYGHVYGSLMGEVDYKDVVFNRRILVVLLPAMEKAPPELKSLGKVVLAAIRSAMSFGLGNEFEGGYDDMIEALPSSSNTPNLVIADEYGYVATEGFAVSAAQARGLGFSCIFAGQDYAGFKRGSELEAEQIVANTKVKTCMALEDAAATWELIRVLGGEAYVAQGASMRAQEEVGTMAYRDSGEASIQRTQRVALEDLRDQIEGEFHVFLKSGMTRGQSFHADPPIKKTTMKIARLCEVDRMDEVELSTHYGLIYDLRAEMIHWSDQQIDFGDMSNRFPPGDALMSGQIKEWMSIVSDRNRAAEMEEVLSAWVVAEDRIRERMESEMARNPSAHPGDEEDSDNIIDPDDPDAPSIAEGLDDFVDDDDPDNPYADSDSDDPSDDPEGDGEASERPVPPVRRPAPGRAEATAKSSEKKPPAPKPPGPMEVIGKDMVAGIARVSGQAAKLTRESEVEVQREVLRRIEEGIEKYPPKPEPKKGGLGQEQKISSRIQGIIAKRRNEKGE